MLQISKFIPKQLEIVQVEVYPANACSSVATAKADVFRKNVINVGRQFANIMKILEKIDNVKGRGVIQLIGNNSVTMTLNVSVS